MPLNFDASGYNHEDLPADSTIYMSIDTPIQKLPVNFYASIPNYLHDLPVHPTTALHIIQIYLEINLPLYHHAFLPANHEDLPID